jgi:signal transduction histidine kinase
VLNLAKAPSALHSRWSLEEIVGDTILLVRLKLHQSRIAIRYESPEQALIVEANKGQLQQVLLNLILNSMHAMPDGGRILLRAVPVVRTDGTVAVELDCTDTGCGIPVGLQPRLFDSFLTGRSDGTGLGLAIVQRILKSHRGDIALVATGPHGTTFRISLPLAADR